MLEASHEVVLTDDLGAGPLLIEASAGSGKTYTLTAIATRALALGQLEIDGLLMVTFTNAAAADLKDRMRAQLVHAISVLDGEPSTEDWLLALLDGPVEVVDQRADRLVEALRHLDRATISTIHGFCQQVLTSAGVALPGELLLGDARPVARDAVRHVVLQHLAEDPFRLDAEAKDRPSTAVDRIEKAFTVARANVGVVVEPTDAAAAGSEVAAAMAEVVREATRELVARQRAGNWFTFDDVLTSTAAALRDPSGREGLIAELRRRYQVVMVDEFQDTDALQWSIISHAFVDAGPLLGPKVVLVGDPKQAIYRFRGADIGAYLRARSSIRHLGELAQNYRSDPLVLEALNELFTPVHFSHDGAIGYVPVSPGVEREQELGALGRPPLELRVLDAEQIPGGQGADAVRGAIAADLAEVVVEALEHGILETSGIRRPMLESDLCVLVSNRNEAAVVAAALRSAGVAVVRTGGDDILASDAVLQWRLLLAGIASPGDVRRVAALAHSWFLAHDPSQVLAPEELAELQHRCVAWSTTFAEHGLLGCFHQVLGDQLVVDALGRSGDLERRLTDLEHLADLLHARAGGHQGSPAEALRALEDLASGAEERSEDEVRRRVESDAQAVRISTIHGAKGLEFNVVLVPFPRTMTVKAPYLYSDAEGVRHLDAAGAVPWPTTSAQKERRALHTQEEHDGDLRLLYVALTRARHHLALWWSTFKNAKGASTFEVLFGVPRGDADPLEVLPSHEVALEALRRLEARAPRAISVVEVEPRPLGRRTARRPVDHGPIGTPAQLHRSEAVTVLRRRGSFTTIAAQLHGLVGLEEATGGVDEFEPGERITERSPSLDLVAGAAFGIAVHSLFEGLDFTDPELPTVLEAPLDLVGDAALHALVDDVLCAPIDLLGGRHLGEFGHSATVRELRFDLGMAETSCTTQQLAAVAAARLERDRFGSYFEALARSAWAARPIGMLLTGSLDLVVKAEIDGRNRYLVADYKTNRLHQPGETLVGAYAAPSMEVAMVEHHYPLQALLYLVALHRLLVTRAAGYDAEQDLLGASYLFVRGMGLHLEGHEGAGVCSWQPPPALVVELDALLGGHR